MKRACLRLFLFLVAAAGAAPAIAGPNVTEAELMQAATKLGQQYDSDYNSKNAAALAALYSSDGMLASPSGPVIRGRDALKAYYADRFAAGARDHAIKVEEVHVQGDGGYGLAQFSVAAPSAGGAPHKVAGRIVAVYRREPGGWRFRLVEASVVPEPAGK